MNDHPDDFCYWIHNPKYLNESFFESLNISSKSNLISALFTEEISNGHLQWTDWTYRSHDGNKERFMQYKGKNLRIEFRITFSILKKAISIR